MADTNDLLQVLKEIKADLNKGGNNRQSGNNNSGGFASKSYDAATSALGAFAKQIDAGGGRLSDVSSNIGKATATLGPLSTAFGGLASGISYLEDTVDVFRRLAKLGGGAAGSLGALRAQAGQA